MGVDRHRLDSHRGWTHVRTWWFHQGRDAYQLEQEVLRRLRAHGLRPAYGLADMPQNGFTETVAAADLSVADLCLLVDLVCTDLGLQPTVDPDRLELS